MGASGAGRSNYIGVDPSTHGNMINKRNLISYLAPRWGVTARLAGLLNASTLPTCCRLYCNSFLKTARYTNPGMMYRHCNMFTITSHPRPRPRSHILSSNQLISICPISIRDLAGTRRNVSAAWCHVLSLASVTGVVLQSRG